MLSWHNLDNRIEGLTVPADQHQQWTQQPETSVSQSKNLSRATSTATATRTCCSARCGWKTTAAGSCIRCTTQPGDRPQPPGHDINDDSRLDAVVGYKNISVPGKLAWYEAPPTPGNPGPEHVIVRSSGR